MRNILIAILLWLGMGTAAAQRLCGTDDIHQQLLKENPAYRERQRLNDELAIQYKKDNPVPRQSGVVLYTIPVVVHVVHTGDPVGTPYNPSDAAITSVIDYLNRVYDGTAEGLSGGVGDIQIQFVLAKRDPNCNPTNGIDRVNAGHLANYVASGVNRSGSSGISDIALKNLSRWDATKYYNIWMVNKIDGNNGFNGAFVAGYAYLPGGGTQLDGTVMLTSQMTVGNTTLPHEIGHALNLYHTFEGSSNNNTCPSNANCNNQGDRVCDTDPVRFNSTGGVVDFTCRTGTNPCTGTDYSINTENNIMAYTNCFTLFTAGQRDRMHAAMNLSDRITLANSLGGTPPYEGTTTCSPRINFETAQAVVTELTETVAGCTGYKDYVFNMGISNSPTAGATATLTATGTALEGTDFLLTTNNNFTNPSKVLSFPANTHDSRSFTIRVFDNAAIEEDKTVILNYTVENGGGNAQKGTTTPVFTLTIKDGDKVPTPIIAQQAQLGYPYIDLTDSRGSQPFDAKVVSKRSVMLYRASELAAMGVTAGRITSFGLFINKGSTRPYTDLQIKMGATSLQDLISNNSYNLVTTTVVKTEASYNTVQGLNLFTLTTPFMWNGTSSIAVEICYSNANADASQGYDNCQAYLDGGNATKGNFYWVNNGPCTGSFGSVFIYPLGRKPAAYFIVEKNGPQTESSLSASATASLGPHAEVYFYSPGGNILARIKNLTDFDYGCTQVSIDRAGTTAKDYTSTVAADKVGDKTIRIVPTNANANGAYELTLFYKPAEVAGWKAATGQLWQNARIVKTPNPVSSYTPGTVPLGIVQAEPATKGAYGADSTITATFNTGFSGFAVGNPALAVPVIYTFTGTGLWTNASNWSNNAIPPDELPSGHQIIINPQLDGECILNKVQTILPGGILTVNPGKLFTIQDNLRITP